MELFSEVYGCYYTVVERLLSEAKHGLTKVQVEEFVKTHGFNDSTFHMLPSLYSGKWNLLQEKESVYYSKLVGNGSRPLTILEKSWLKAILQDERIGLFLGRQECQELQIALGDIEPLFEKNDFHIYDQHRDGDDYSDPDYQDRFHIITRAIRDRMPLLIEYCGSSSKRTRKQYYPYRLSYSVRDDKFRLICGKASKNSGNLNGCTLNLGRITEIRIINGIFPSAENLAVLADSQLSKEPVVLEISTERNALERCMMEFASFKRQTEYDRERELYICRLWYDPDDETELLIRILSFGPVLKVLGPEPFLNQVKERISRQISLLKNGSRGK